MGRHRDAILFLRKAHAADSNSYTVCNLLGACLIKIGQPREAAELFAAATRAQPQHAEGWANLSVALSAIGRRAEARESADKAVSLKPNSSTALGALGAAQLEQGRLAEAVDSYRQGVALPGPSTQMLLSFASALLASGLNEEAIEQLQRAATLDPHNLTARWAMVIANLRPLYQNASEIAASRLAFARSMDEIETWYRDTPDVCEPFSAVGQSQPFFLAYQPFNNRDLLSRYGALCATWMATLPGAASEPSSRVKIAPPSADVGRKLRVGIASAHISEHSVWNAITKGWVHNIDQTKFELTLFQLNPAADEETKNARLAVANFEDRQTNLPEWIAAIRQQNLDVLIYPEVGMHPLTLQLAALRLAPVQATTWGHPETSGLPTMDLYISADALEPTGASDNYSEKLVALPNLGVYVEPLAPAVVEISLRSLNLPSDEPLLLCPGSPFKYSPLYDDVWINIAKQLRKKLFKKSSGGRLVFFRSRSDIMDRFLESRLRTAFDKADVEFDAHVSIIPMLDRSRFFGLMRQSALMLDTLGFSGFNTALQAVECDLPVLAFEGQFMRGRLASGIMHQLDLPELVAKTPEEFIQKAIELAGDAGRRARLRGEIISRRNMLFNNLAPVRALEKHLTDAVMQSRDVHALSRDRATPRSDV
jgi:protein O-GlcNAc transferase